MSDLFVRFGGHEHAAGVTLDPARDESAALQRPRRRQPAAEDFLPRLRHRCARLARRLTAEHRRVFALAPFGHGNQRVFAAMDVEVTARSWAKRKHLKVTVRRGARNLSLKAWNFRPASSEIHPGAHVDTFTLEEDPYSAAAAIPHAASTTDVRPPVALMWGRL